MTKLQDAAAVAKIALGFLFASAFQVPMAWQTSTICSSIWADTLAQVAQYCMYRFCKHPEYRERLRAEAVEYQDVSFGSSNREMPYMDSFVKETSRLSPGPIRKLAAFPHERRD